MQEGVLPHDIDAERSVLGALLLDPKAIDKIAGRLRVTHFYNGGHAAIYEACLELFQRNEPIDAMTVAATLRTMDQVMWEPRVSYLAQLVEFVPTATNIDFYTDVVIEYARKRAIYGVIKETEGAVLDDSEKSNEILDRSLSKLFILASDKTSTLERLGDSQVDVFIEHVRVLREGGELPGLPYPWPDLSNLLGGLRPSEMTVVCGRPGMGKTAFALNVADFLARRKGVPVGIFSLEMSKKMLVTRLISQVAGLNGKKVRDGKLTEEEWQQFLVAARKVSECPIWVDDYPSLDEVSLLAKAREMRHKAGVGLFIVDYIQLMEGHSDNRERDVSGASKAIRRIAREFEVPVLALGQLNRGPETRHDKRPILSDLRESGGIENEADVVLGIYRDEHYYGSNSNSPGIAEIIVLKHRNGEDGTARLGFSKSLTQFRSLDFQHKG